MTEARRYIGLEEWVQEGFRLFGSDMRSWKYRCPACGNVQGQSDFDLFKGKKATLKAPFACCVGVLKRSRRQIYEDGPGPCEMESERFPWLCQTIVSWPGGRTMSVFDFAPNEAKENDDENSARG